MKRRRCLRDDSGDAVVEAAILFPIITLIFIMLCLLALYLPTRALMQTATQEAATVVATVKSDTWISYSDSRGVYFMSSRSSLPNVYASLLRGLTGKGGIDDTNLAQKVVSARMSKNVVRVPGDLQVRCDLHNYVIYKEVVVTAVKSIPLPIRMDMFGMPDTLDLTVSSTAVVQNGDEFVRTMDIAVDIVKYLRDRYEGVDKIFDAIEKVSGKVTGFLGI